MSLIPRILSYLEKNAGNLKELIKPRPILTDTALKRDHLEDLFAHRACALHIKDFYPKEAAAQLSKKLTADDSKLKEWLVASPGRGLESSDVRTVGLQPYSMVAASKNPQAQADYFDNAVACMRALREGLSGQGLPLLSPLDKLRLELDEIWPHGATVTKNRDGKVYVAGLARVMTGPTELPEGFCHVDDINPLTENEGLFSANLYLQMPEAGGGELLLWDIEVRSRWEFYRHATTLSHLTAPGLEGQSILRSRFPSPRTLRPQAGDLVLLCAQRPHAVQGFPFGTRVSIQSFLSHKKGQAISMDN